MIITLKDQLNKIKENWLIVLAIVLLLLFTLGGNIIPTSFSDISSTSMSKGISPAMESLVADSGFYPRGGNFAPEIEDRKIVKTTSISTEVERGTFKDAESRLINIVSASDSILLNQNSNKQGKDKKTYYTGRYTIKIDTSKYDSVIAQMKDIGKVTSFSESQRDITGNFQNTNIELESERARLSRYQKLFEETIDIEQKIQLTDRIFNQERTIRYMENSLKNLGQRVDYSTVTISINEKKSDYANIVFVKFSELIKNFVGNLNLVLKFIVGIIPWAAALLLFMFVWRFIKRKKKK